MQLMVTDYQWIEKSLKSIAKTKGDNSEKKVS
jgi:hypothetical protein